MSTIVLLSVLKGNFNYYSTFYINFSPNEKVAQLDNYLFNLILFLCAESSNESQTSPSTQQQQPTLNMNTTAPIRKKSLENLKCDYCNRVFNSDSSRKYHINSSHYNVKNEKCDRAFGSFEELKKHNEEEHWHSNHNFFQGSSNVKNNSKVIGKNAYLKNF